jgi:hypothetical protein
MRWLLGALSLALLGGWFGSWALFALVVAPKAFQVLPSHEIAGDLVSPLLAVLHNYGIAAGLALGVLARIERRGIAETALPVLLAGICAASEYLVTPGITAVEPTAFGPAMERASAERFSDLHQTSRTLFGVVEVGVLVLIGLRARRLGPRR